MIYDAEQAQLADALARFEAGDTSAAVAFHQVLDKVMVRLAKLAHTDLLDACVLMEDISDHEGEEQLVATFWDQITATRAELLRYGREIQEVERWHSRMHYARRRAGLVARRTSGQAGGGEPR